MPEIIDPSWSNPGFNPSASLPPVNITSIGYSDQDLADQVLACDSLPQIPWEGFAGACEDIVPVIGGLIGRLEQAIAGVAESFAAIASKIAIAIAESTNVVERNLIALFDRVFSSIWDRIGAVSATLPFIIPQQPITTVNPVTGLPTVQFPQPPLQIVTTPPSPTFTPTAPQLSLPVGTLPGPPSPLPTSPPVGGPGFQIPTNNECPQGTVFLGRDEKGNVVCMATPGQQIPNVPGELVPIAPTSPVFDFEGGVCIPGVPEKAASFKREMAVPYYPACEQVYAFSEYGIAQLYGEMAKEFPLELYKSGGLEPHVELSTGGLPFVDPFPEEGLTEK